MKQEEVMKPAQKNTTNFKKIEGLYHEETPGRQMRKPLERICHNILYTI